VTDIGAFIDRAARWYGDDVAVVDGARRQAGEGLLRSAHLNQGDVAVGLKSPLSEDVTQQKVVRSAEARDAELFAL